jgi:hypothetical protein
MDSSGLRSPVVNGDLHQDIVDLRFGIFDVTIEIAVIVEHACVKQLIFRACSVFFVFFHQFQIRECFLWVFVEESAIGMGRRGIKMEIELFHVLAVVAFSIGQTKESLFQYRVFPVPECRRKAQDLVAVTKAADAFLAPAIGIASGKVVVDKVPGSPFPAIVFSDGAPLTFREIGAPFFPVPVV